MNPYSVVRKTIIVMANVFKYLLLALCIFLLGALGFSLLGPWGWVVGPMVFAAFCGFVGGIVVQLYNFQGWWKKQERAYNARSQTVHEEASRPAP